MTTRSKDEPRKTAGGRVGSKARGLEAVPGGANPPERASNRLIDNPVSKDVAKLHDAKASIANQIKIWFAENRFKSIKAAASEIGEQREMLSRILSFKLTKVSLDKLYRIAVRAGLDVRVDAATKLQIADEMSNWMTSLLEISIAKLHQSEKRSEFGSHAEMLDELLDRLRAFRKSKGSNAEVIKMICNDKIWGLDPCSVFYSETAAIARRRNWEIRRVLVGAEGTIIHNTMLAQISAGTGAKTTLLDISGGRRANFLPPKNVGFWILGNHKIIMHTSSKDKNHYVVEEVDDSALAAYLDYGVFAQAEVQGQTIAPSEPLLGNS